MTARHPGNKNWGRAIDQSVVVLALPTEWERLIYRLRLERKSVKQQCRNAEVKEWVRRWARSRYVPPQILDELGLTELSEV